MSYHHFLALGFYDNQAFLSEALPLHGHPPGIQTQDLVTAPTTTMTKCRYQRIPSYQHQGQFYGSNKLIRFTHQGHTYNVPPPPMEMDSAETRATALSKTVAELKTQESTPWNQRCQALATYTNTTALSQAQDKINEDSFNCHLGPAFTFKFKYLLRRNGSPLNIPANPPAGQPHVFPLPQCRNLYIAAFDLKIKPSDLFAQQMISTQ